MTVIDASSVRMQTMADGTLRLTVDIEPMNAQTAFALFAKPGTPIALAALKSARHNVAAVGHVFLRAVELCKDTNFWEFIAFASLQGKRPMSETEAANIVKQGCGVQSRREFDSNEIALAKFQKLFEHPFHQWTANHKQRGAS